MSNLATRTAAQIISVVSNWPREEGECKPSSVCGLVAEPSMVNYQQCAGVLSKLIEQGKLKLEPQGRGLHIP